MRATLGEVALGTGIAFVDGVFGGGEGGETATNVLRDVVGDLAHYSRGADACKSTVKPRAAAAARTERKRMMKIKSSWGRI